MKKFNGTTIVAIGVIAFAFIFLASCGDDEPTNQNTPIKEFTSYPADSGNYWEYDQLYTFEFDPDTVQIEPDSGFFKIHVSVTGHVMLDTLKTIEFSEYNINNKNFAKNYYKQHTDGFYNHAHIGNGAASPTKTKYLYKLGDLTFDTQEALLETVAGNGTPLMVKDSLYYENPPVKSWNYPIQINSEWVYRENSPIGKLSRKVVGINNVETPAGLFQCYKIKMVYHDTAYSEITYHDYISEIGLVKRTLEVENIVMTDIEGNVVGVGNSHDTIELTQFSVAK